MRKSFRLWVLKGVNVIFLRRLLRQKNLKNWKQRRKNGGKSCRKRKRSLLRS